MSLLMITSISLGAEQLKTIKGKITITRDDAGNKSIILIDKQGTKYNLIPGENNKKLAEMDKKTVKITGILSIKENTKTIIVQKHNQIQEKAIESDMLQLDTLVVESERASEDKQHIKSRTLKLYKVVDLSEILSDKLVEVQMIRKSGYGNEVSMRGFGQENMKVLLDGGILEGACGSRKDPSLSHINMLTVDKIIIRQGPFDVTKPGCLGGYVNVVTKKPKPGFNGELLGKIGSYDFYSSGFVTSGGNNKIQGLFGYNFSYSDQYKDGAGNRLWKVREGIGASYNDEGQDAGAFLKHDIWGKLQFTPNEQHTILFEYTYGRAEDILTPRVAFDTKEEITHMSKASWEMRELGDLSKKLTISFYCNGVVHHPFQDFRNVAVPKNNEVESIITGGGIQNITETDFATITYGVNMYHRNWWGNVYNSQSGAKLNDNLIPSVNTLDVGIYVQIDKKFKSWSLGLGLRYDYFQQEADEDLVFTSNVTDENQQTDHLLGGYISMQYFITGDAMLFGGIGRSYRTPTGTERYIQGNPTFFGNPNLKPTANTEFDLGFRCEYDRWMFQIKGFYSILENYIYQENNLAGYKSYTNINARIFGFDIKSRVELIYGFFLKGGLAYQYGQKDSQPDNNDDANLGQIAPLKGRLALGYEKKKPFGQKDAEFFGSIEWVHSSKAGDVDEDAGEQQLPEWNIMNLRLGYRYKFCMISVGIDNVFDAEYSVANSYEWDVIGGTASNPAIVKEPGRFIYGSLNLKW